MDEAGKGMRRRLPIWSHCQSLPVQKSTDHHWFKRDSREYNLKCTLFNLLLFSLPSLHDDRTWQWDVMTIKERKVGGDCASIVASFPTLRRGSEYDDILEDSLDTDSSRCNSCSGLHIRVPFNRMERREGILVMMLCKYTLLHSKVSYLKFD